jgi:hypothetical protein
LVALFSGRLAIKTPLPTTGTPGALAAFIVAGDGDRSMSFHLGLFVLLHGGHRSQSVKHRLPAPVARIAPAQCVVVAPV